MVLPVGSNLELFVEENEKNGEGEGVEERLTH